MLGPFPKNVMNLAGTPIAQNQGDTNLTIWWSNSEGYTEVRARHVAEICNTHDMPLGIDTFDGVISFGDLFVLVFTLLGAENAISLLYTRFTLNLSTINTHFSLFNLHENHISGSQLT